MTGWVPGGVWDDNGWGRGRSGRGAIATGAMVVRWNSPWYGIEGPGWFVSYHVFTRYVKVTFLNGASLRPVPLGAGKDKDSRWVPTSTRANWTRRRWRDGCGRRRLFRGGVGFEML